MVYKLIVLALFFLQYVFARDADVVEHSTPNYVHQIAKNVFVKDCSENKFPLHIRNIKIMPDVVVAGEEITIEALGFLEEPVDSGANANVVAKLGSVKLFHEEFNLCDEYGHVQCPIKKGPLIIKKTVTVPTEAPEARLLVDIRAFLDQEQRSPLVCLEMLVDFRVSRS